MKLIQIGFSFSRFVVVGVLSLSLTKMVFAQVPSTTSSASSAASGVSSPNLALGAPADPVGPIMWNGETFNPVNLGSQKLAGTTFVKLSQYPRGLAFQSNGDLLATIGSGTTPLMGIIKWTGTAPSNLVSFQFLDFTAADFKNPDKMKELTEGEAHGVFWFFGGPLAVDGKDQVYFNLGACGPNGLYQLLQPDPIKVKQLFPSGDFEALQFFPSDSEDLYATSFGEIGKMQPADSAPSPTTTPFFSLLGNQARLLHTLVLDEDHVLATLILPQPATSVDGKQKMSPPKFMAVVFDRKLKGYFVLDIKQWGPMAVRPTDKTLFRFDADAKEIRQFSLPFLASADSAAPTSVSQPETTSGSVDANLNAGEILRQSRDTYAALKSYSDTGTITSQMGTFGQSSTFSIRLQRPSLYRIAWEGGMGRGGVTWSDGSGDFLRYPGNATEAQKNRQMALAGATGISGGAAANIPGTFFADGWGGVLSGAGDVQLKPDETIDQVACHVVVATMHPRGSSLTITCWIGQQDHLLHKIQTVTLGMPAMPKLNDTALKSILQKQNKPPTPEAMASLREELSAGAVMAKRLGANGMTSTQVHQNIETDKTFAAADFKPAG